MPRAKRATAPAVPPAPAARQRLKEAGVRPSVVRGQVLSALMGAPVALSHQELMQLLPEGADRVTVYRTLQTLEAAGLVHSVKSQGRGVRFAAAHTLPDHHVHVHCQHCGAVACLDDAPPPPPAAAQGWRIKSVELVYLGTCPRCLAQAVNPVLPYTVKKEKPS